MAHRFRIAIARSAHWSAVFAFLAFGTSPVSAQAPINSPTALRRIALQIAVVETTARMQIRTDGKWMPAVLHRPRVIEFHDNGLVRRVIDYPW